VAAAYRAGGDSLKIACKKAAEMSGFSKNELYELTVNKGGN
jgi:16S rRNA C1402 (ribose-2'-O) methylase RsmI